MVGGALAAAAPRLQADDRPLRLGYNTYCVRSLGWHDDQLLDYAVKHKLDAIFLQDTKDPRAMDPSHWPEVRARAIARLVINQGPLPRRRDSGGGAAETSDDAPLDAALTSRLDGVEDEALRTALERLGRSLRNRRRS